MSNYNYTPIVTGATASAANFNAVFAQLDAAIKLNKYDATTAPTVNDDTADGYTVGSRWIDVTNDLSYTCLDATAGAAVWGQALRGVSSLFFIGDNANAAMTAGLTINQGAADNEILSLKSSDVAHGVTSITETDTYGYIKKFSGADGGVELTGLVDTNTVGLRLRGISVTADGTYSTAGLASVIIDASLKSGTGPASIGADKSILAVRDDGTARFFLDSDGDSHQDVSTAWTNFDAQDDVALLNLLSAHVTRAADPMRESFGEWLAQNRAQLERLKLVTFNADGHSFVNMSRLTMLLVGAARQMGERLQAIESRLAQLESGA